MNILIQCDALQPYLIPGFWSSIPEDIINYKNSLKQLDEIHDQKSKDLEKATKGNVPYVLDQKLEKKSVEITTRNGFIALRLIADLFLSLHAFKFIECTVRILAAPVKFFDAPILPLIGLTYVICAYLISHDLIKISRQNEDCLSKIEPEAADLKKAQGGFWASIKIVAKYAQESIASQAHQTQAKTHKYYLVRDTFFYPLWCLIMDNAVYKESDTPAPKEQKDLTQ